MRIAVIAVSDKRSGKLSTMAHAVAREFSMMGHVADYFESVEPRVSGYDFIAVCSEPSGSWGSMGSKLGEQLSNGGNLVGKRSLAFLFKAGLRPGKALSAMMRALEKEGMVVTMGEVVASDGEAVVAARSAPLQRG